LVGPRVQERSDRAAAARRSACRPARPPPPVTAVPTSYTLYHIAPPLTRVLVRVLGRQVARLGREDGAVAGPALDEKGRALLQDLPQQLGGGGGHSFFFCMGRSGTGAGACVVGEWGGMGCVSVRRCALRRAAAARLTAVGAALVARGLWETRPASSRPHASLGEGVDEAVRAVPAWNSGNEGCVWLLARTAASPPHLEELRAVRAAERTRAAGRLTRPKTRKKLAELAKEKGPACVCAERTRAHAPS
jgi:hypothetical protein